MGLPRGEKTQSGLQDNGGAWGLLGHRQRSCFRKREACGKVQIPDKGESGPSSGLLSFSSPFHSSCSQLTMPSQVPPSGQGTLWWLQEAVRPELLALSDLSSRFCCPPPSWALAGAFPAYSHSLILSWPVAATSLKFPRGPAGQCVSFSQVYMGPGAAHGG